MNEDQLTTLLFDLLTAIVVFGVPWRLWRWWHGRRQMWKYPLAALAALGWLVVVYGSFVAPRILVTTTVPINLRDASATAPARTMTVALVSDTHFGFFQSTRWAEQITSRIQRLSPDAVIFAGDIVSNDAGLMAIPAFKPLSAPLGKYAILGNWDYHIGAVDVRKKMGSAGVKTLVNRAVPLAPASTAGAASLYLVGLDDLFYGTADWTKALAAVPPGAPWIAAVHEPEGALWASHFGARLVLSGHTHGGQVVLPVLGAVAAQKFPVVAGIGRRERTTLFVSRGVGTIYVPVRINCPPEVALLTLQPA